MKPSPLPSDHLAPQPHIAVLGVEYLHLRLDDGSDLYLTEHGVPYAPHLLPSNHWEDTTWRKENRIRLLGSSSVFRIRTKEVDGRSIDVVLKWNRMAQDVTEETAPSTALEGAEFNSPFMEFSLVYEMRDAGKHGSVRLYTHKPLAIYVPRRSWTGEQLGRKRSKMKSIRQTHDEIEVDWNRQYAVIYEWLKGIDAAQACGEGLIDRETMVSLYQRSEDDLKSHGFLVRDNKPRHVILRPRDGAVARDKMGAILYGLIDFELLERTPEREETMRLARRREYLSRQAHQLETTEQLPPGLYQVSIMGVDYIYGEVESTGGALWVVGRDPNLFDYFLPEKWRRTPRSQMVSARRWYETVTKDDVHVVWRDSRVGQSPEGDPFIRRERRSIAYGYNSPFEEFSIALELQRNGVDTKYPRAIYMTGQQSNRVRADRRRYKNHAHVLTPSGTPILNEAQDYMTIWAFWNGLDHGESTEHERAREGADALTALQQGKLTQKVYLEIMKTARKRLAAAGIEDLSLCGGHLLLSFNNSGQCVVDDEGIPLARIRNCELMKRMFVEGDDAVPN